MDTPKLVISRVMIDEKDQRLAEKIFATKDKKDNHTEMGRRAQTVQPRPTPFGLCNTQMRKIITISEVIQPVYDNR